MPKLYRDALTGQYTTAEDAAARPAETVAETVPARHETPDVAELRRLAEAATPGPWTFEAPQRFEVPIERELCCCSGVGDEYELVSETADGHVHLWHESHIIYAGENVVAGNYDYEDGGILERRDRDYIAAASPDVVLGLLDRLAHMTEARDNARAWDEGGDFVTRHPGMSAEYVRAANPYRRTEWNQHDRLDIPTNA